MRQIPPLILREQYFRGIEEEINKLFYAVLYGPLVEAFSPGMIELQNSRDPLLTAVQKGTVWYENGKFLGSFNSRITKRLYELGAKYDARDKSFTLTDIPAEISMAKAHADMRYDALRKSVLLTLDDANISSIDMLSDIPDRYMETIDWMEGDFQKAVDQISIPPKLTDDQRGIIAAEWGQNLDMYIRNWTGENILSLRNMVQENAFAGHRAENLAKAIEQNYGVSRDKAKFLARQETSLLMSKFREVRYRSIGADKYIWRGSKDERERHDHRILEGQIFSWDMPPVVDRRTGRRANPGEDFNCRCVAVALIE